jgi:sugar phosphate isomerase/epimerase
MTKAPTPPDPPRLPRSWKHRYPFRLACPSFVYPADYDVNADRLGPHVDEIELLLFESRTASLPTPKMIARLADIGMRHAVGYHVHLPTDTALVGEHAAGRCAAAAKFRDVTRLAAPLKPRFFVLHLEVPGDRGRAVDGDRRRWEAWAANGLQELAAAGCDLQTLRIENQFVPLDWLASVAEAFDLKLCLDIGHLHLTGQALEPALARCPTRLDALHIHGAADGRDHRSLTCLPSRDQKVLARYLRSFRGSVTVEVFDFEGLEDSLRLLEKWMA